MAPTFPVFFLKVRFLYLPDNEMAERKKWELSEAVKEDSEVLTLQGYRQMVALAGLRDFLRSIRKDCSPEAMETWPLGGTYFVSSILCPGDRFVSRETTEKLRLGPRVKSLKSRTIKTMLRVHERISAEPAAEVCIRQLDDRFGSQRVLATLNGLDLLSAKTFLPKNPALARAVLLWVTELPGRSAKFGGRC